MFTERTDAARRPAGRRAARDAILDSCTAYAYLAPPRQSTAPHTPFGYAFEMSALSAAFRAVAFHELLKLYFEPELTPWVFACYVVLLLTMLSPDTSLIVLTLMMRLYQTWTLIPTRAWDSFYWTMNVDGGLLLLLFSGHALRISDRPRIATWWANTSRVQLGIFYVASGFWKINKHFLDPRISCAPIFFLTLATSFGLTLPPSVGALILAAAPAVTIIGEMAIGVLFLAPKRAGLAPYGVALALLLHLGIALTPPPNNATPFALTCVVRLVVTAPTGFARALEEVLALRTPAGVTTALMACGVSAASVAIAYARDIDYPPHGPGPAAVDVWVAAYGVIAVVLARGLMLDDGSPEDQPSFSSSFSSSSSSFTTTTTTTTTSSSSSSPSSSSPSSGGMAASPAAAASGRRLRVSLVALAAWYGFAGPLLGTQDLGACNMYSNLRMHGGSNHLLLPTDLLGSLFPGTSVAFAMRTVRVEHTSSAWINSIYPNEITSQMSPKERTVLREAGHLARMFNPMKSRILSPAIGAPPPAYAAPPGSDGRPFARWTVPTLELRRLLAEAREQGEAFSLTYTLLDGQSGDERWRRSGGGRTVTITEDGKGGRTCTLCPDLMASLMGSLAGGCACADDELPLMPPPPYLARKLLVQQPYPIVGDERDDPEANFICYGP